MAIKKNVLVATAAVALAALVVPAHGAQEWPATKSYIAGSAGVAVSVPGVVAFNNAGGAVDCSTGAGGVCFDTTSHFGLFTLTAVDDAGGSATMFAGFDLDGDGCVGCTNGDPNGDLFFQGSDTVTGFVPTGSDGTPLEDPTLYVFVRIATLNTGDLGSTGEVTIKDGCPGPDPRQQCQPDTDPEMGTVCAADPTEPAGKPRCGFVMYPYPGNP